MSVSVIVKTINKLAALHHYHLVDFVLSEINTTYLSFNLNLVSCCSCEIDLNNENVKEHRPLKK